MQDMFWVVFAALIVATLGNIPIAALRRYFVEESRRVPEIGALELLWGGFGATAGSMLNYGLQNPQISTTQAVIVGAMLTLPTIILGAPIYRAARGSFRGFGKAAAPSIIVLPLLALVQTNLYKSGLPGAVVGSVIGVAFTLVMVASWGFAVRKGLLTSTTRDVARERMATLEATLEEERGLITQLTNTIESARRSRQQQLAELRDAENRIAELEQTVAELQERNAQGSRDLEQARAEISQLMSSLETAHTIRDEQLTAARGLREQVQELEAENAQLRSQLEGGDES